MLTVQLIVQRVTARNHNSQSVKRPQQGTEFLGGISLEANRIIITFSFWPDGHA